MFQQEGGKWYVPTLKRVLKELVPEISDRVYSDVKNKDITMGWDNRGHFIWDKITTLGDVIAVQEFDMLKEQFMIRSDEGKSRPTTIQEQQAPDGFTVKFFPRVKKVVGGDCEILFEQDWETRRCYKDDSEGVAVIFKTNDFELLDKFTGRLHFDIDQDSKNIAVSKRKIAGLVHLKHLASDTEMVVVSAHFMTVSRDKTGVVRSKEMAALRHQIEAVVGADSNVRVVIMADFNTDFTKPALPKGFNALLHPVSAEKNMAAGTGFNAEKDLEWDGVTLTNVFKGRFSDPGASTNERSEWLDGIFVDTRFARVGPHAFSYPTAGSLPNCGTESCLHPSDHVPVVADVW